MYILYKLQPRAETTDTLLLFTAKNRNSLEEILLSIYDELVDKEIEWAETELYMREETIDMDSLRKWCSDRMQSYGIVWVPELED
jgi:hypothetical protein